MFWSVLNISAARLAVSLIAFVPGSCSVTGRQVSDKLVADKQRRSVLGLIFMLGQVAGAVSLV